MNRERIILMQYKIEINNTMNNFNITYYIYYSKIIIKLTLFYSI